MTDQICIFQAILIRHFPVRHFPSPSPTTGPAGPVIVRWADWVGSGATPGVVTQPHLGFSLQQSINTSINLRRNGRSICSTTTRRPPTKSSTDRPQARTSTRRHGPPASGPARPLRAAIPRNRASTRMPFHAQSNADESLWTCAAGQLH